MKLVAGRTGQEYNQRTNRRGAYWEDRYHATAVESGEHLARCLVYVGRNIESGEEYQLRESPAPYKAFFEAENEDIDLENTRFWDVKAK